MFTDFKGFKFSKPSDQKVYEKLTVDNKINVNVSIQLPLQANIIINNNNNNNNNNTGMPVFVVHFP